MKKHAGVMIQKGDLMSPISITVMSSAARTAQVFGRSISSGNCQVLLIDMGSAAHSPCLTRFQSLCVITFSIPSVAACRPIGLVRPNGSSLSAQQLQHLCSYVVLGGQRHAACASQDSFSTRLHLINRVRVFKTASLSHCVACIDCTQVLAARDFGGPERGFWSSRCAHPSVAKQLARARECIIRDNRHVSGSIFGEGGSDVNAGASSKKL